MEPKAAVYFVIQQIKDANKAIGHHWFEPGTLRFFNSRVSGPVIGNMFVSSEKGPDGVRRYTIRKCTNGAINTVGEFQAYATKAQALRALRAIAANN